MPPVAPSLIVDVDEKDPKSTDPMGGPAPDEMNEFDDALDDAFEAVKSGDKAGFRDALGAAITAKCAEMYGDEEPASEGR